MKNRTLCVVCRAVFAAGMVVFGFGSVQADIPASAYVQDGLIAQWDGIENAGTGTHDANATTTWVNLKDASSPMTLSGDSVWTGNGVYFNATKKDGLGTFTVPATPEATGRTVETAACPESGNNYGRFFGENALPSLYINNNCFAAYCNGGMDGAICDRSVFDPIGRFSTYGVSVDFKTKYTVTHFDGVRYTAKTTTCTPTYATALSCGLANRASDKDRGMSGTFYALRVYNRVLTDVEVAINANIDKIRFEGSDPSTLTWPDGYRWNNNGGKIECRVRIAVDGVHGTVALDGEEISADYEGWFELGTAHTVEATSAANWWFARWECEGLTDAQRISQTLTLKLGSPVSISPFIRQAATKTWVGTSESANVAENWSPIGVPETGDAIVLNGDCNQSMTWDIDNVKPGSWLQDGYTGTVTFKTGTVGVKCANVSYPVYGVPDSTGTERVFEVGGDMTVLSGTITSEKNPGGSFNPASALTSGLGIYRLLIKVGGAFTLGADGVVTASECGFKSGQGPGRDPSRNSVACYGGYGVNSTFTCYPCYGSVYRPVCLGSSDYSQLPAGGAVKITAAGAMSIRGCVTADGTPGGNGSYASTGGSVLLIGESIEGDGTISAHGSHSNYLPGGGGRVALVQTGAASDFSAWTGTATALGGEYAMDGTPQSGRSASCGTVYYETADKEYAGDLHVIGRGALSWSDLSAQVPHRSRAAVLSGVMDRTSDYVFDKVVIRDCGNLGVGTNVTVTCNELIGDGRASSFLTLHGGTFRFTDAVVLSNVCLRSFIEDSHFGFTPDVVDKTLTLGTNSSMVVDVHTYVDGNLVFDSDSKLAHTAILAPSRTYRVNLEIGGNLTLGKDATINLDALGWDTNADAPGYSSVFARGGSHGGLAPDAGEAVCYGSIRCPITAGSSGRHNDDGRGGGVATLKVAGGSKIDGVISARGEMNFYYATGAGGSIWLTTGTLEGTGLIRADGGYCRSGNTYAAGGGRVAIWLTDPGADFSNFSLENITASGGTQSGNGADKNKPMASGGTIYLKKGNEADNEGTLYVSNPNSTMSPEETRVMISDQVTETDVGEVVVTNGGALAIAPGNTLTVKRGIRSAGGSFTGFMSERAEVPNAEVVLVDAEQEARIAGLNDFANLTCVTPGKTLRFGADAVADLTRVNGVMKLAGEEGNPLFVKSAKDGEPWLLDVEGSADVSYVTAWDSDATPGKPVVDVAGVIKDTQNWSVIVPVRPGATNTWSGADQAHPTDWTSAANWSLGRAPADTDYVILPTGCEQYPVFSAGVVCNALVVRVGATLDIAGYDLVVTNLLRVTGTLKYAGGETITFSGQELDFVNGTLSGPVGKLNLKISGEGQQKVNLANLAWNQIRLVGKTGALDWRAGFTADALVCVAPGALAMTFAAGERVILRELEIDGSGGGVATLVSLASAASGSAWRLKVTQFASLIGVAVGDSDASESPLVIFADQPSQDNGRNSNWNFTRERVKWLGGTGDFTDATKWSSGEVPNGSALIIVETNATIHIVGETHPVVQELRVIGAGNTFGGDLTLKVVGSVLMDGGELALDVPLEVGNAMFMLNGSVLTHTANTAEDVRSVDLSVTGNLTIDATSAISAQAKGYALGKGYPGSKSGNETAHGGRPRTASDATACYGSVMCPTNSGSSTDSYGRGGGRVRVVVGGLATVDGAISANGYVANGVTDVNGVGWLSAAGGSVWATFGSLVGSGVISANAGRPTTCADGGGGRVAVYLTDSSDFESFAGAGGVISAYGSRLIGAGNLPKSSCGTVYLEGADGKKRIVIDNDGGTENKCLVDFPVPVERGGDDPKRFRDVTLVIRNRGAVNLLDDVLVGEVEIATANTGKPTFFLNDHTLTIRGLAHKRGKGWANYQRDAGESGLGRIVWQPRPLTLIVR